MIDSYKITYDNETKQLCYLQWGKIETDAHR